jgi:hypothetical protein
LGGLRVAFAVIALQFLLGSIGIVGFPHPLPIFRINNFFQLHFGSAFSLGNQLGYLTVIQGSPQQLLVTVLLFLHCSDSMLVFLLHCLGDPHVHRACCLSLLSRNAKVHPFGGIKVRLS